MLTPQAVEAIFADCLFKDNEDKTNYIAVEGIAHNFGFHPERLESHRAEIRELLDELPAEFKEGWSFLMACNDKHGNQWTGLHLIMEQLFCLGMGLGMVNCLMPKEFWSDLPGGMPYYQVN